MFELSLLAPEHYVEPASDALIDELGAHSVSVQDADAGRAEEQALFGEPGVAAPARSWQRSSLRALFDSEAQATAAAAWLLAQDWGRALTLESIIELADQDWVRLTQSQFTPSEIIPGFWVVASWHEAPPGAQQILRLDPGQAFGTGTHPTTRMCLRWIARNAAARSPWPRVLDYGCGSGILAIAAALYGAQDVDALDIDPIAVEAARANAFANRIRVRTALPDMARGEYALVLANILATPLKLLAPLLCAHVGPGGTLVLAGILERQASELREAYAPWLPIDVGDSEDGWILMTGQRATHKG